MNILMVNKYMLTRRTVFRGIAAGVTAMSGAWIPKVFSQEVTTRKESVKSADGTTISYTVEGSGPPIVFAHGSLETGDNWLPVAMDLADRFNCYTVDRRGHGNSGPVDHYSLYQGCEDLQAVLERAGPDAALMGASYGAIVAMETALRFDIERLILYEPPLTLDRTSGVYLSLKNSLSTYRKYVRANRLDDALTYGLKAFAGWTDDALKQFRQSFPDDWAEMKDLAPTWTAELEEIEKLPVRLGRYRELRMPTLLITGSESPKFLREIIDALGGVLPDSQLLVLQGHGHNAHVTAPELLADGIAEFLRS